MNANQGRFDLRPFALSGGGQVPQSEPCRSVGYREFRSGLQVIGCRRTPKLLVVPVPDRQQSGIHKEPEL